MFTIIKNAFPGSRACLLFYMFIGLSSCTNVQRNNSHPEISNNDIKKGKALAAIYCQSCHALPDPALLDSKSWQNGVLPAMGPRLGIFSWNYSNYPSSRRDMNLDRNFYPKKPLLTEQEWKNLMDYYVGTSPDTLSVNDSSENLIKDDLINFSVLKSAFTSPQPATSFLKFPNAIPDYSLIIGDAIKRSVYVLDNKLNVIDSLKTTGPILDLETEESGWIGCDPGILNPHNGSFGSGRSIFINNDGKLEQSEKPLFAGLARPVQISVADLNNDGKQDYLICEFGFQTGALSWMENRGGGNFDRHVIRPVPGAIKAYIDDYNHDGLPDFWVLFAQGDEGIFLFTNKGKGKFDQKRVLGFPPVYGSSYFEFADFNKDGHPDIVYTCGDNADYSPVLKPYHGVSIFLNDGKNNFRQKFFFHLNGCYKAIARDYDNDGDIDIATISFFADFKNHPDEGFVYLENKGNFSFQPYSATATQEGRWLTMEAGDINKDGKTDLVLGNFSIAPAMSKSRYDWKKGPPFLVLLNTGKKHF